MKWKICALALILLLLITCGSASAARYEFQDDAEGWINQKTAYDTWSGWGGTTYSLVDWRVGEYLDLHHIGISNKPWRSGQHGSGWYLENIYPPEMSDSNKGYFAFTYVSGYCNSDHGGYNKLILYHDEDASSLNFNDIPTTYSRVEFISEGQGVRMYIDGVQSTYWSSVPVYKDAVFRSLGVIDWSSHYETSEVNIDDVVIGSQIPNLVSTFPKWWYLMKDPADYTVNGMYQGDDRIYDDIMHSTWAISTLLPEDITYTDYKIITKHQQTGNVVNITSLNTSIHKAGIVEYNIDTMLFDNPDAPYGNYIQTLYGDDQILDTTSFMYISGGGNILFDKDQYYSGYSGTVGWDIGDSYFDTDMYTYCAKIQHISGTEKTTWPVTQKIANKSITWDEGDADGTYIVSLIATEKETQQEYYIAYDLCSYATVVTLQGAVYDAEAATRLPTSTVTIQQNDVTHTPAVNTITAEYNVTELVADSPIIVTGSAPDYVTDTYTFTPLQPKIYNQNIYLLPENINHADNSTAIAGLVQSSPYYQAIESANITISNINYNVTTTITVNKTSTNITYTNTSTTNSTTTTKDGDFSTTVSTNPTGFYLADNLPTTADNITVNSTTETNADNITVTTTITTNTTYTDYTYSVATEKENYVSPDPKTVTTTKGEVSTANILLNGIYQLQVQIRDASTHALILDPVFIELQQDGVTIVSQNTEVGNSTFHNLNYGIYTLLTSAEGYYTNQKNVLIDDDTLCTIYLNKNTAGTGAGIAYPPHNVVFYVRGPWGEALQDVTVTATYLESSGPLDWLFNWLGLSENLNITETKLEGTTGYDGAINFMMVESVKYQVTATRAEDNISASMDIYPKDDYYTLYLGTFGKNWFESGKNPLDVHVSVTTSEINEDEATISVHYMDPFDNTNSVQVYLNQSYGNGTEINIDSDTITTSDGYSNFSITDQRGQSYKIHAEIDHGDFSKTIHRDYGVAFKTGPINLGLPDGLLLYAAMFLIIFTALLIPETQRGPGAIFICFEMWVLFAMGWWDNLASIEIVISAISFATLMAIFFNIMLRSKKINFGM